MTKLMRKGIVEIYKNCQTAHAGLLIQRGLKEWDEDSDKPNKKKLIEKISGVKPNELYHLAFKRWLNHTYDKDNFANLSAKIDGRLFTGLALGGALETGVMTHQTYGMPMIAGSSVKGAVRNYAEHLFAERDEKGNIRYHQRNIVIQENKKPILDILFGTDDEQGAGYLIWHDAWWIPAVTANMQLSQNDNNPFVDEVVTVHHQTYYQGNLDEALDIENPIPNQQIAIQGEFYFAIEGEQRWVEFAKLLLERMLTEQGLGAKGSNGYGYFDLNTTKIKAYIESIEQNNQLAQEEENRQQLEKETADLSENQALIYTFKHKLSTMSDSWKSNPNTQHGIEINGEKLWFNTLFDRVNSWSEEDQKYALQELFTVNQKSLSKKMQEKVKELKKKLGVA